jgi:hypothetical protein
MVHGSDSVTRKSLKSTLTKHHPDDRFEDLLKREFFNGAFKKSLLVSHESPPRKQQFSLITG